MLFNLILTCFSFSFQENIRVGVAKYNAKLFPTKPPKFVPHITGIMLDLLTIKETNRSSAITIVNSIINVLEKSTTFTETCNSNQKDELKFLFEWQMSHRAKFEEVYASYKNIRLASLASYLLQKL